MKPNNLFSMQKAIIDYINSKIPKDPNKAHIGTFRKGMVTIGSETFSAIPVVDLRFDDGDRVACLRPENSNDAVIVGVL